MNVTDKNTIAPKKVNKWVAVFIWTLAIIVLLVGGYFALRYIWGIDLLDRSGWSYAQSGETYYLDYYGKKVTGWMEIDEKSYYFDPAQEGKMHTGWLEDGEKNYYFADSGALCSGWTEIGDDRFFLDPVGRSTSGWETIDGLRYYLDEYGKVHTGWLDGADGRYYLDEEGKSVSQWVEIEEERFYFYDTGRLATGWLELPDGTYILDEEGHVQTGWTDFEDARYYLGEDGRIQTGWLHLDDGTYYLKETGQMAVGKVEIDDVACFFASNGKQLLFVNRWNPVPEGLEVELDLLEGFKIATVCKEQLQKMIADCRKAGYRCDINTAYRSYAYQKKLWDYRYNDYLKQGYSSEKAADLSARRVLPPGTSEHQLGLAVDLLGPDDTFQWLEEHAPEYGFILRYPEGKTEETGVMYEPWHFRYLGKELAEELTSLDMTLDAYMEMLTEASN